MLANDYAGLGLIINLNNIYDFKDGMIRISVLTKTV